MCFFNENMEMALREIWKTFFLHENPYTGLRYCDDPTIVMTELKNEDSTFWALEISERTQSTFYADVLRQYSRWLGERYGTDDELRLEPVMGTLRLRVREPQSMKVYLLGLDGRRDGLLQAAVEDGEMVLPMPGEYRTVFYELCGL